mgnify:CR=1 FL=1
MKRIVMILVCLIWGFFALPVSAETYGETEENSILAEDDALDYSQVQQALDEILPETSQMSFSDLVTAFAPGSVNEIFSGLKDYILDQLFYEVTYNWKTMGQMIGIVLISSVFTSFSMAFSKNSIADTGFYLTYMVLFTLLLTSFHTAVSVAEGLMENMLKFMTTLVPTFCLSLTLSGHLTTAALYQQLMLAVLTVLEWLVSRGILKLIHIFVLLSLINQLSREDHLSKLADFFHTIIGWTLKTILGVVLGLNVVQNMILPAFDTIKNGMAVRVVSAVPGVGDAMESAVKTVAGGAAVIKNAVGGAGIFILALLFLIPAAKLGCMALMYQLSQALVQPVADKRMLGCMHSVSVGILLLMKVLGTVFVLFVISLAMITSSSGLLFGS